jgi:RHS repeat-associated protein
MRLRGRDPAGRANGSIEAAELVSRGSTVRVADTSFAAVDLQRYTPFGEKRNPPVEGANIPTDRKFTGQIEDASIGLQWFSSRTYDPALRRFLQPRHSGARRGQPAGA